MESSSHQWIALTKPIMRKAFPWNGVTVVCNVFMADVEITSDFAPHYYQI